MTFSIKQKDSAILLQRLYIYIFKVVKLKDILTYCWGYQYVCNVCRYVCICLLWRYVCMYVCRFASDTNISESNLRIFF